MKLSTRLATSLVARLDADLGFKFELCTFFLKKKLF